MFTLNHVMLIGYAGKDPEVHTDLEKLSFARLQLATHSLHYSKEGQRRKITHWHTVFLRYVVNQSISSQIKKGMKVFVQGELRTSDWKDHEGKTHRSVVVFAYDCQIMTEKESGTTIP